MKFSGIFALTLFGFLLTTSAYPTDSSSTSFDIGGNDNQTIVTDKMIADTRQKAVQNADEIFHSANDPMAGNPNGDMILVEYMDYGCSNSREIAPNVQGLLAKNPNLRIVYKEFPIHGEISVYAAKAALAAQKQGKFLPFHLALMNSGKNLTKEKVLKIAAATHLDMSQLQADMHNSTIAKQIESTSSLARNMGVLGTPGLFFAKSNISNGDDPNSIFFMLGKFTQKEFQQAINYIEHQ